jgi:hypothetical protein
LSQHSPSVPTLFGSTLEALVGALETGMIALSPVFGLLALLAVVAPASGQAQVQNQAYHAPLAADGHPDLNGIWQAVNTANYDLEVHAARHAMALRPGPHGPVPAKEVLYLGAVGAVPGGTGVVDGGVIPYKPEALNIRKENREKWLERDPEIKCYLPGVPRATYMPYPFRIFQTRGAFAIAYEYAGAVRNIFLKDPGQAPTDSWMGQSVGRWDGEAFVIETTGLNGMAWLDRSGNFTSENVKVTERFKRIAPDHLLYEATIDDPDTFTRPWKISMPLYRRIEQNAQLMEFRCVEFVEELMYGEWRKNPLPR